MADYTVSNDAFAAFVKKAAEDAAAEDARRAAKTSGKPSNFSYETQTWVGLVQHQPHILRLVGNPPEALTPGFKAGPYDAHEIFFESIKDDNGDKMQLRLPLHAEDINDEHIMWKIINKVLEVEWRDDPDKPGKRKSFPKYEKTLVYEKVTHGGWDPNNPKEADSYKYSKGWGGQQVTIMNVIDREDDWCATNKHTKLLSKKVKEKDGVAYPTIGIPSYGFLSPLKKLCAVYGSWENYDIQIVKNGTKETPYDIKNATYYKEKGIPEIFADKLQYVSMSPSLTDEEKAYARYDIAKYFGPTSYKNLRDRLGKTIQEIDATFNTHFYMELKGLAEKEEKEKAANEPMTESAAETPIVYSTASDAMDSAPVVNTTTYASAETTAAPAYTAPVQPAQPAAMPTRTAVRTAAPATGLTPEKIAALAGWEKLPADQRAMIKDVVLDATGKVTDVIYTDDAPSLCTCDTCTLPSPSSFNVCPVCGAEFIV